ncbi:MAG: PAS domain S-box protein [Ferruginibacter sp.]
MQAIAIFILDKTTTIIDANEYACRLTGYSREELLGMKVVDFISPEELEKQVLFFELLKKNMAPLSERRLRRKDGTTVDTEINARLLEDEGYISIGT